MLSNVIDASNSSAFRILAYCKEFDCNNESTIATAMIMIAMPTMIGDHFHRHDDY